MSLKLVKIIPLNLNRLESPRCKNLSNEPQRRDVSILVCYEDRFKLLILTLWSTASSYDTRTTKELKWLQVWN
jgi:hypothetical protein